MKNTLGRNSRRSQCTDKFVQFRKHTQCSCVDSKSHGRRGIPSSECKGIGRNPERKHSFQLDSPLRGISEVL